MKKLITSLIVLILLSGLLQAQVTDVAEFRIANATTAFGRNLPVGTKVYNIATGEYFVATAGILNTLTLTTGSASFKKITASDETYNSTNFNGDTNSSVSQDDYYDNEHLSDTDDDGLANKVDLSSAGLVKTAADGTLSVAVAGTDYDASPTNELQTIANTSDATSHTATLSQSGGSVKLVEGTGVTIATTGTALDGIVTISATADGDGSATNEGVIGVGAGAANTAVITSNTSGANGVTINGGNGIVITETTNTNGGTINITSSGGVTKTEAFEEASGTPTAHALTSTAIVANGARVSLNGATLKPDKYTLTSSTLTLTVPVLQYDQVIITYTY